MLLIFLYSEKQDRWYCLLLNLDNIGSADHLLPDGTMSLYYLNQ